MSRNIDVLYIVNVLTPLNCLLKMVNSALYDFCFNLKETKKMVPK